jgi:hypothetical protein
MPAEIQAFKNRMQAGGQYEVRGMADDDDLHLEQEPGEGHTAGGMPFHWAC